MKEIEPRGATSEAPDMKNESLQALRLVSMCRDLGMWKDIRFCPGCFPVINKTLRTLEFHIVRPQQLFFTLKLSHYRYCMIDDVFPSPLCLMVLQEVLTYKLKC